MSKDPILIAGAGPTGLVLAIWLKTLNPSIAFRIISKASGPGTTSRAMVVHARTLELYRQLGVAEKLIKVSTVIDRVTIWRHGVQRAQMRLGAIGTGISKYPYTLSSPQDVHERVLVDHLKMLGVEIEWNQELQELEQFSDHVSVTINGVKERYSYIAGCDGAHSTVRRKSRIELKGGSYPQSFFVADVRVAKSLGAQDINLSPDDDMMAIFIRLDEVNHFRIVGAYVVPDDVKEPTFEHVRPQVKASTTLEVEKVEWFSVYRVYHGVVDNFQDRRVFLAGDAAHQHSPVGGQGMNTGIGDASNLAWKLASVWSGSAPEELLNTYNSERHAFAETLVNTTDRVFTYFASNGWAGWFVRAVVLPYLVPLLWKIPPLQPKYFLTVSQVGVEYPTSALSQSKDVVPANEIYAGQRLPWLTVESTDTHEPFSFPQWHIIRFLTDMGDKAVVKAQNGISVRNYQYTQEAGTKGFKDGKCYLVRPDGHVGLVFDELEDNRFEEYVKKWGVTVSQEMQ